MATTPLCYVVMCVCTLFIAPSTIQRESAETDKISQRILIMSTFL